MLRALAIGTLTLAGVCAAAHADVYRWVDEHGSVHYSDEWVPGSQLIKTTRPHPRESEGARAVSEQPKSAAGSERAAQQVTDKNVAQAVKQDVTKTRDAQCKEAKERYEKAIQARRIYKPRDASEKDEDRVGERQYLSDDEADAYRIQARKDMQDVCGNS